MNVPPAMRTIVVPTDCSEVSLRALQYADRLAAQTGASVIAVYGQSISARPEGEGVAAALASHEDLESMVVPIRRCVEETVGAALSPSTQRSIVIADRLPADAIIGVANAREADVIVIGTRDRNRLVRMVLGSVTDAVLHLSNRPVLILRESKAAPPAQPVRRILCPFRDTEPSFAAVKEAKRLAQELGAELQYVHAIKEGDGELSERFRAIVGDAPLRTLAIGPNAAADVIALADELHADLIVLGSSHRRFSDPSVVGTPASQIVRTAHCPVLVVCA
jgi:nucleotide-binding universal stress UspA family protein